MTETLAVVQPSTITRHEFDVADIIAQVKKIQMVMEKVMRADEHYGVIPGTEKPTLLKPGAEKLCLTFRLATDYASTESYDGKHLTIKSRCTLFHIPTGQRMGCGEGSCSTKESKFAYRYAARKCPDCGRETIIKGKEEYGGGWLCFKRKGGCGAKFVDGNLDIEKQETGRVPNEELADSYNTVLKMANKRSLVAACLNVTAASDIFTQDLEEEDDQPKHEEPLKASPQPHTLTPDPATAEQIDVLLGKVTALGDKLQLKGPERAALWTKYCGHATPKNVDLAAISDLYAALQGLMGQQATL